MAKTIFRKKKRLNKGVVTLIAVCVATILVGWLLAAILIPGVSFIGIRSEESEESEQPAAPTKVTQPRASLPKEFVDNNLFSPHVVLYDVEGDQILYKKGENDVCYPASLTKLMTALVAMDYTKAEDVFTLGEEVTMIAPGSSQTYLSVGTKLTMENLLQALLLPSGNDAAYAIAVQVGRIIEKDPELDRFSALSAFIEEMNNKAKDLGCTKTTFKNPDGYHEKGHQTTAKEMLYIARAAIENKTIKTIVSLPEVKTKLLSGQSVTWQNSNRLLLPDDAYFCQGAFGLKTGSTDEAGRCLAACATRNGRTSIVIVMGAESENGRWEDARGLLEMSFQ